MTTPRWLAHWSERAEIPSGRIDALQGVRGVAVLLVVISHVLPDSAGFGALGGMGVTIFFALSGFLITGVLLSSRRENLRHLGGFYGARAVRLLPALLVLIIVIGLAWLATGRAAGRFAEYGATALFYVENFFAAQHDQQVLAHTWSLAVEEQFYLLWPFLLLLVVRLRPRDQVLVVSALVLLSIGARFGFFRYGLGAIAYTSLPTNSYALLLGCLFRLVPLRVLCRPWMAWVGLGGVAVVAAIGGVTVYPLVVAPVLTAGFTVLAIAGSLRGNRLLAWRPLVFVGAVSYAWYLWHWPLLWLTESVHRPPISIVVSAAALGIAALSTFLIEDRVRRIYQSWLRRRQNRSFGLAAATE